MTVLYDIRDAFAAALESLAEHDQRIVAVASDAVAGSKLLGFKQRFQERLVAVGNAEQTLIDVGVKLANQGYVPFVCSPSYFLSGRALEQIKGAVGYSGANVKLCSLSSGIAYSGRGGTHQSVEDFAWARAVEHMTVVAPADPREVEQAVRAITSIPGPVFLRLSRMAVPVLDTQHGHFAIGKAATLRSGNDVTLIANGIMVAAALEASELLSKVGIAARVLNMSTVRPLDRAAVIAAARETGGIVTVEEHTVRGGLGGAVASVVAAEHQVPVKSLGVPSVFSPVGSAEWLLEYWGLSANGIVDAVKELLAGRGHAREVGSGN